MNAFDGVKVFSATKQQARDALGETVSEWINRHPEIRIVDIQVTQTSDRSFHCLCISVFYVGKLSRR